MMLKLFDLLDGVLNEIENGLKDNTDTNVLAKKFLLSSTHLRRLFRVAFGQTIGNYIRSRKLAASIHDLLHNDLNVLDIALDYGFEYEQSFIRSFRREFGLTPGELRKTGQIVKIKPPLHLFNAKRIDNGVLIGPDIVFVPQFHVAGRMYNNSFRDALTLDPYLSAQFAYNERSLIPDRINSKYHINFAFTACDDSRSTAALAESDWSCRPDYSIFMPSVQVKSPDNVPESFDHYTFPSSLCARFCFIGQKYEDFNVCAADAMFSAIDDFMDDEQQKYFLERKKLNFELFDLSANNSDFVLWEWFAPVRIKTKDDAPDIGEGIFNSYEQKLPRLCFIGKKYIDTRDDFVFKRILDNLDSWRLNFAFDAIEKQSNNDLKSLYGGNSYISLIRKNDNDNQDLEYWLGMFMPPDTPVPKGYEKINFPESTFKVYGVYGRRDSIINFSAECGRKFFEENISYNKNTAGGKWFFQRFNWHRFFEEDRFGKRILEYCFF